MHTRNTCRYHLQYKKQQSSHHHLEYPKYNHRQRPEIIETIKWEVGVSNLYTCPFYDEACLKELLFFSKLLLVVANFCKLM